MAMVWQGPVLAHLRQYWPEGFSRPNYFNTSLSINQCSHSEKGLYYVTSVAFISVHCQQVFFLNIISYTGNTKLLSQR